MGKAVMGTLHGANRLLERDVPLEATIIGANLAHHLLSKNPRKVWHAGVEIVAVLNSKGPDCPERGAAGRSRGRPENRHLFVVRETLSVPIQRLQHTG